MNWKLAITACLAGSVYAQSVATVTGGRLSVRTPASDQSVKVEVRESTARLFGFPGIADGTAYAGLSGASIQTGGGNDKVEVEVLSSLSFDIAIQTGSGAAETSVKWRITPGVGTPAASVQVGSAPGSIRNSLVEVQSESNRAAVAIDLGTATEAVAKVVSPNNSEFLKSSLLANATKVQYEVESSAAALELDIRGGGTALPDDGAYVITQKRTAAVTANFDLNMAGSADKLEIKLDAPGSTVTQTGIIRGGLGDDDLKIDTAAFRTTTGLEMTGAGGNDKLEQVIQGGFQASQTLQTRMLGGDGNDILILTTSTGIFGTGLPGDLFPVINCGLGADEFNAFGQILGCEARL